MRLFLATLILPSLALAQGALTPPSDAFLNGAPKATMKSLDQVEPRIPLVAGSPGVTINAEGRISIWAAGSYYLTGNLTVASSDGVAIWTSDVTLDLNGFTITSTAAPAAGVAIFFPTASRNNTVRNGHITGAATIDSVTGGHSGSGFINGVYSDGQLTNCLVSGLTVNGVRDTGIYLDGGSVIEHCVATNCGQTGIRGQTVAHCSATNCGQTGIIGTTVANSQAGSIAGSAILATIATDCLGTSTSGIGLYAAHSATNCAGTTTSGTYGLRAATSSDNPILGTAESCKGTVSSGTGIGLSAGTASNCIGLAAGGIGLEATTATNCAAESTGTTALSATNAENCHGLASTSGLGIYATKNALNCSGTSNTGVGLSAGSSATNCNGVSTSGIGLLCIGTATGCVGTSTSGIGLFTLNATNCRGTTTSGDYGLLANDTAQGSYGHIQTVGDASTRKYQDGSAKPPACGLKAKTANTCTGSVTTAGNGADSLTPAAIGLSAEIAAGCRGEITTSGSYNAGLQVDDNATNCSGISPAGYGLRARNIATGCTGTSTSGTGLNAGTADACHGKSNSGYGLFANIANNSEGISTSSTGLFGGFCAANSRGVSSSGIGLSAINATGCYGSSSSGSAGLSISGTANTCTGSRLAGTAISAAIAIGCTPEFGTISAPSKQLGTP